MFMQSEDESRKRKSDREEDEDEEEAFKRSKKIGRSPLKNQRKMEENIELMMNMIRTMGDKINDMSTEVKQMREEHKEYKKEIIELRKENQKLHDENQKIKILATDMEDRIERLENDKRRNNVVLYGLDMDTNKPEVIKNAIDNFMQQELQIKVEVTNATKIGNKTCLIQLANQTEKIKVMQNKSKLRMNRGEKFFIQDDLSKKDRDIQKQIRTRANEEKKNGKITKIGYRKLYIGTEEWTWGKEYGQLIKVNEALASKNE